MIVRVTNSDRLRAERLLCVSVPVCGVLCVCGGHHGGLLGAHSNAYIPTAPGRQQCACAAGRRAAPSIHLHQKACCTITVRCTVLSLAHMQCVCSMCGVSLCVHARVCVCVACPRPHCCGLFSAGAAVKCALFRVVEVNRADLCCVYSRHQAAVLLCGLCLPAYVVRSMYVCFLRPQRMCATWRVCAERCMCVWLREEARHFGLFFLAACMCRVWVCAYVCV